MRRTKLDPRRLMKAALAVPAAALMLGAAEAGTTVGLNFQAWYYDSGSTPQTVGYGFGYQTTGFPVTAKAFGVEVVDWTSTEPLDCMGEVYMDLPFAGGLNSHLVAPNAWQSGIGELEKGWVPQTVAPGDNEVTWGYLDDGNTTGKSPQVSLSSLKAKFPAGYVVQAIAANQGETGFDDVDLTDGVTTETVAYATYYVANAPLDPDNTPGGTVGLTAQSKVLTGDTLDIKPKPKSPDKRSVLAGFILTDKPVVSRKPADVTVNQGDSLTLSAGVIGIPPISYQWQHAGTNVPGATTVPYTRPADGNDTGNWVLVATNLYGSGTSVAATVTVIQAPVITTDLAPTTNLVYSGFSTPLSVVAGGARPLSYQWKRNGADIPGATDASFTVQNSSVGLYGYHVVVTNAYGVTHSFTNSLNVVAAPDPYTTQVGADQPLVYWPLNESTGASSFDYSGFGYNGAISNTVTLGVTGPRPPAFPGFSPTTTAYSFDGSSWIDCGTGPALSGTTDFTLEAWISTTSGTNARLIQQRSGYVGEYMFDVNGDGTLGFTIYGGDYQFDFKTTKTVNDGNWHQIVAVRKGADGFIYIDGKVAAQATGPVQALNPTFTVGLAKDVRDNNAYYFGKLLNVAIYDKALTPGQILSHYEVANGTSVNIKLGANGTVTITWAKGTLTSSPTLGASANWQPVSAAQPPSYSPPPSSVPQFFRVLY